MNAKERKREDQELQQAVKVMRAAIRSIARRKARRYEHEFLGRVRDMIDEELSGYEEVNEASADYVGCKVKTEIMKD